MCVYMYFPANFIKNRAELSTEDHSKDVYRIEGL